MLLLFLGLAGCSHPLVQSTLPVADTVQVLSPGIISTGREFAATFLLDGRTILFTRSDSVTRRVHIFSSRQSDGHWQSAAPVNFSGEGWSDLDPSVSPDGRRLYFVSTRPRPHAEAGARSDMEIWYADKTDSGWSEPQWLEVLGSSAKEGSPTVDRDGTVCFFSDRDGPPGSNAIFCSTRTGSGLSRPARLNAQVNAGPSDTSPFLAPDGRTLLFYSTRAGGAGQADLYASFKTGSEWGAAINLGPQVNTAAFEYNPVISRDGSTLIFGRNRQLLFIPLRTLGVPALTPGRFR
ncbi:MAG: hypothetical protein ABI679_11945 [Gemmatimonadota bacterium]